MTLIEHARQELEAAGMFSEKGDFYGGMTGKSVMELIEVFSNQGHSGMSAGIVSSIFNKLADFKPLGPLTGRDEEWSEAWDDVLQNKRCSGVFKHKDGRCTYNYDIIKRCPNGATWSGPLYLTREDAINNVNQIKAEIKEFPFTPKTFYIDVIEEEIAKDDWIMWVKDPNQLDAVWEYYKQTLNT
jgi:hypothetical protein